MSVSVNGYIVLLSKYWLCAYYVLSFVLGAKDTMLNRQSLCSGEYVTFQQGRQTTNKHQEENEVGSRMGFGWQQGGYLIKSEQTGFSMEVAVSQGKLQARERQVLI